MKQIIIVRHAKAEQSLTKTDYDRMLTNRGIQDATNMALRHKELLSIVDCYITSSAVRALTTAQLFATQAGLAHKHIIPLHELYHASALKLTACISQIHNALQCIIIFAHNPGITHYINATGLVYIDNLPTCGIFAYTAATPDWSQVHDAEKKLVSIDFPKK